jgi:pyruvate ferredoxin oxidoreductase alpha subunit
VIDQNLSLGQGGVLFGEISASLHRAGSRVPVASFVGGLGGRDLPVEEFVAIAETVREAGETGTAPPPRLLFTAKELEQVRTAQAIAGGG